MLSLLALALALCQSVHCQQALNCDRRQPRCREAIRRQQQTRSSTWDESGRWIGLGVGLGLGLCLGLGIGVGLGLGLCLGVGIDVGFRFSLRRRHRRRL